MLLEVGSSVIMAIVIIGIIIVLALLVYGRNITHLESLRVQKAQIYSERKAAGSSGASESQDMFTQLLNTALANPEILSKIFGKKEE